MEILEKHKVINALTVDVEEWFHVSAFSKFISLEDWPSLESTIEVNIYRILELLEKADVRATFFVLGWVAERYSNLILDIKNQGHEIGSHGYAHRIVYQQRKEEFESDIVRSIDILGKLIGKAPLHYRAPSYSITRKNLWAWEVLLKNGIKYDSSVFPIIHHTYGIPNAPRFPFRISIYGKELTEFPLSTIKVFGHNVPIAGGAYLRLYPLCFIKKAIRRLNCYRKPFILYFHPWELDQEQPIQKVSLPTYIRHYGNIDTMYEKVTRLIDEFDFAPMSTVLDSIDSMPFWPV